MTATETADRLLIPPLADAAALHASWIDAPVRKLAGATMGTGWSLAFAAPESVTNAAVVAGLEAGFDLVIRQMSNWEPGSDLCAFNRAKAGWRELRPEFFAVLEHALEVARLTDGAYDPALAAEVEAFGFGPSTASDASRRTPGESRDPGQAPSLVPDSGCSSEPEQDASAALGLDFRRDERGKQWSDWRDVRLDPATRSAFQPGGVALDLSSIAKGYAVDLCAERLGNLGIPSFLMEIGGEFKGQGVRPDGQPWRVELTLSDVPPARGEPVRTFAALVGLSLATSGDFIRRKVRNGRAVSHILDGRTRRPLDTSLSGVSVLHPLCMSADAWATALMALGLERGMATAEAQGLAAVFAARRAEGAKYVLTTKALEMLR